jgi:glutathione S-transferase
MAELELFWISGSPPAWRVMLTLAIKHQPYQSHRLDAATQDHKAPAFLALNPRGQVPVLRVGATAIRESLAIMAYLDRAYPEPPLFGSDAMAMAQVWQWLLDFENHSRPAMATVAKAAFRHQLEAQPDRLTAATTVIQSELTRIEDQLSQTTYLQGAHLSAVDVAFYPTVQWLKRALAQHDRPLGTQLYLPFFSDRPALAQWEQRIEALPGYDHTYPPHWRSPPPE